MSFTASFSFAYVDAVVIVLFLLWALWKRRGKWYALAAACVLPSALVTIGLCGSTLLEWPKGQLYYGSHSVSEMWHSLVSSTFYQLNEQVVNPLLYHSLDRIRWLLPNIFYATGILLLLTVLAKRHLRRAAVCGYLAGVLALSFSLYWLAHVVFGVLLPMERTASFFVPLTTLFFGIATGIHQEAWAARAVRTLGIATLVVASVYFVGCLRLSHFKEWKFDAETKEAFGALMEINRQYGIQDIAVAWDYYGPMHFYERYYGRESMFHYFEVLQRPARTDKPAYVLRDEYDHDFVEKEKLKVVYLGPVGGVIVAIRPPDQR